VRNVANKHWNLRNVYMFSECQKETNMLRNLQLDEG
jgi:DNA-directed RNA polymerase delta subunit